VPAGPVPAPLHAFLAQPNLAVMTTVRPNGHPVSVATWYLLDGERFLINMDERRKRIEYVRQNPRVALIVLSADDPRTYVSIQGRVTELVDDGELRDVDRLWRHYEGGDYPHRDHSRVTARVEVDRWHGWGAARTAG
jgi:PPOX class probable F420-dependent enzyme